MSKERSDPRCDTLRFGEPWEKLELLKELEEIAKDCRSAADKVSRNGLTAAERERNKPWREFRRRIGFPLFELVLDMAQGGRSESRDVAADILAHLWHPAAVDRLVEDIKENADTLLGTQFLGIFINLGGIGTEVAARGLISLWEEPLWRPYITEALEACGSKAGEAFLMTQALENKDPYVRGSCISRLNSEVSDKKINFLQEKLKRGESFERLAAIKKILEMRLTSMAPDLMNIYNTSSDPALKEIRETLRSMRKR